LADGADELSRDKSSRTTYQGPTEFESIIVRADDPATTVAGFGEDAPVNIPGINTAKVCYGNLTVSQTDDNTLISL
jgi:hypothetical protein